MQVGWGLVFGNQSLTDFSADEPIMVDKIFGSWNALNIGLALGFRISPNLKISVYSDRFDTFGETAVILIAGLAVIVITSRRKKTDA